MKTSQKKKLAKRGVASKHGPKSVYNFHEQSKRDLVRRGDGGGKRLRATVQSELLVNLSFYAFARIMLIQYTLIRIA